jgi:Excalibur calcium-binding domain
MTRRRALSLSVAAAAGFTLIATVPVGPTASAAPYGSCKEAIADGAAPLFEGDPGWNADLDANGDGMACLAGSGAHYFPPKTPKSPTP